MQLVTVKFLVLCKFSKNNCQRLFTWTQSLKNGQELLVEWNKNHWICSYLKLSQIKQIIEVMIKYHLMIRKIAKINTENLINTKMEAIHNKFFQKLNNKFSKKSKKKRKERNWKCKKSKKNCKKMIKRKEEKEDPKIKKILNFESFDSL